MSHTMSRNTSRAPSPLAGDSATPTAVRVTLQLSGAPRLLVGTTDKPLEARDALLLAWLALEGPTARGRLAELLFPSTDEDKARNRLRQRLFQLRKRLDVAPVSGDGVLQIAAAIDVQQDEGAELLAGVTADGDELGDWLQAQRERHRGRRTGWLAAAAEQAEAEGELAAALAHAFELSQLQPESEHAHRRVMRLHYLRGDRAAALAAYRVCEQTLAQALGTRPSSETRALLQSIEAAQPVATRGARPPPTGMLRPPRLVGRTRELEQALAAWEMGRAPSISGEAGMGKSRLLYELASRRPGAVMAQARPGDAAVPYAALARLLRDVAARVPRAVGAAQQADLLRLLPDAGTRGAATLDGPAVNAMSQRRSLQQGVTAVLAAASHGGVTALILDDLHFADDASLDLLTVLTRPGVLPALRFAFAQRPAEGSASVAALNDALLEEQLLAPIALQPFDAAQMREFVASLGLDEVDAIDDDALQALAVQLHRHTGGNPLFALETLRQAWVEQSLGHPSAAPLTAATLPRPVSVGRLIERRMQRLTPAAARLARCLAIAGQDFSITLATEVLGAPALDLADAWAELEQAQMLRDGAFAHDLIFEAALASVPTLIAQHLHRDVAAFLARHNGPSARIAAHRAQAQQWAAAGTSYLEAARQARDASRHVEHAALLADAAHCLDSAGEGDAAFDALVQRAEVLAHYDIGASARASIDALQARACNDEQRLRATVVRLNLANMGGETQDTLRLAPAALATAVALGRDDLRLELAVALAGALADERRADEAVALLAPLRGVVEAVALGGGRGAELHCEYWQTTAYALDYSNRLADALPAWRMAADIAQQMQRNDLAWQSLANLAATEAKMGHVRQSADRYRQALLLARAGTDAQRGREVQAHVSLAHRLRDLGEYGEAVTLLEDALAHFDATDSSPIQRISAEHRLAQAFMQLGQPARARPLLAGDASSAPPGLAMMRLVHRADLAHQLGGDALTPMRAALALLPDPHDVYHRIGCLFASAIVPPDEGEVLAAGVAVWAATHQRGGLALAGHVRAAGCALAQGAAGRAAPHADHALHLAERFWPDSFYLPQLWLVGFKVFSALGRDTDARRVLQTGVAWVNDRAQHHVPMAFRDSFLHRNAVNRELLTLSTQWPPGACA